MNQRRRRGGYCGIVLMTVLLACICLFPLMTQKADAECGGHEILYEAASAESLEQRDNRSIMYAQAACSHNYGTRWAQLVAPTCAKEGKQGLMCSYCGAKLKEETIPKTTTHTWGNWVTDKSATCTATGKRHRSCTVCGTKEYQTVAKANHKYSWVVKRYPSCGVTGEEVYKCSTCGYEAGGRPIDAYPEHDWEFIGAVDSTCTENGYCIYHCKRCGFDWYPECYPAKGHDYVQVGAVTPTCQHGGYDEYHCSRCGDVYRYPREITGHKYEKITILPTCTENGQEVYECAYCGNRQGGTVIQTTGHHYVGFCAVTPTCTEDGYDEYHCSVCGDVYRYPRAKIGHNYVKHIIEPTCTENGQEIYTCTNCGDTQGGTVIQARSHSYVFRYVISEPTLYSDGDEYYSCEFCPQSEHRPVKLDITVTFVAEGNDTVEKKYSSGSDKLMWAPEKAPKGKRFVGWSIHSENVVFTKNNTIAEVVGGTELGRKFSIELTAVWCDSKETPVVFAKSMIISRDMDCFIYLTHDDCLQVRQDLALYTVEYIKSQNITGPLKSLHYFFVHMNAESAFGSLCEKMRPVLNVMDIGSKDGVMIHIEINPFAAVEGLSISDIIASCMQATVNATNSNWASYKGIKKKSSLSSFAITLSGTTRIGLQDYIGVKVNGKRTFGINQTIFEQNQELLDILANAGADYALVDDFIREGCCAPTAAINVTLYLSGNRTVTEAQATAALAEYLTITDNKFNWFFRLFENPLEASYDLITEVLSNFTSIESSYEYEGGEPEVPLLYYLAKKGLNPHLKFVKDSSIDSVTTMLQNGYPVLLGLSDTKMYQRDASGVLRVVSVVPCHEVVITGILQGSDSHMMTLVEISSWGEKYYLVWDEITGSINTYIQISK